MNALILLYVVAISNFAQNMAEKKKVINFILNKLQKVLTTL